MGFGSMDGTVPPPIRLVPAGVKWSRLAGELLPPPPPPPKPLLPPGELPPRLPLREPPPRLFLEFVAELFELLPVSKMLKGWEFKP